MRTALSLLVAALACTSAVVADDLGQMLIKGAANFAQSVEKRED
jgi:hypothetical protein